MPSPTVPAAERMQAGIDARRGIVRAPEQRIPSSAERAANPRTPDNAVVDRIANARRAGYSDEEIAATLAEANPRVKTAIDAGYAPDEVFRVLAQSNTGQPYIDQGRTRGDEAQLGMAAGARAARAEQAAGPQGFARAGGDLIAPGRAAAEMLIEGQKQTQQGGIGSYAAGQAKSAGGAFLLALSPVTGPLNVGRAEIERRVEATGAPGVLGTLPFDAASMAIPLSAPVKMANALKNAGAGAGRTSKTAADLIAAQLAARLTEEQKLKRAIATARPSAVRPRMMGEGQALLSSAKNENNAATVAADNARSLADALKARQIGLQATAGERPVLGVAPLRDKSARGADARLDIEVPGEQLTRDISANDTVLRDLQREISDAAQASGKSVADLDDAKALLRESEDALNPPLGTTRDVSGPLDKEALTIHGEIAQALRQRQVAVSHADALTAAAQGDKVRTIPPLEPGGEPTYIRTFKTSFDALDTLRRRLGQSFGKEMEGFSAISNVMRRGLATRIDDLLTQFVGGVHPELQANWRNGILARAKYEEAPIGRAATERVGETNIPIVPDNRLPATVLGRGEDGIREYLAASGSEEATLNFLKRELEADFQNATHKSATKLISANGKVGSTLGALERGALGDEGRALAARVRSHVDDLQDAHQAGVDAPKLATQIRELEANQKSAEALLASANTNWLNAATWTSALERSSPKKAVEIGLQINKAQMDAALITPGEAAKRAEWLNTALANKVASDRIKLLVGSSLVAGAAAVGQGYLVQKGLNAASGAGNLIEP